VVDFANGSTRLDWGELSDRKQKDSSLEFSGLFKKSSVENGSMIQSDPKNTLLNMNLTPVNHESKVPLHESSLML